MYLIKLALRPWRVAPLSQVGSSLTMAFMLVLAGLICWVERGIEPVIERLQGEQIVTAFIASKVEVGSEEKIADSIRASLGAHPSAAAEVKTVTANEFTGNLMTLYPELARELLDLGSEGNDLVPRYVTISGMIPDSAVEQIKSVPGVESVESSKNRYQHIVGAFFALKWVSGALLAGILLALATSVFQLARMNGNVHREAIALLRLWGAGALTMRIPGILSGAMAGLLAGSTAAAVWYFTNPWLSAQLRALSPLLRDLAQPSFALGLAIALAGVAMGTLSGFFGAAREGR